MARANHAKVLQGTAGTSRNRRRRGGGWPAWLRPYRRARHAMEASERLVRSCVRTAAASGRRARHRPIHASQELDGASARLIDASSRLERAALALAETTRAIAGDPYPGAVPELLKEAAKQWVNVAVRLEAAANEVFTVHEDVLHGLETGALVPEQPAARRPRIVLAPRSVFVRAFLTARQPRVVDRIAAILQRRRRTPRPAALRVPRRSIRGRAPPSSLLCTL